MDIIEQIKKLGYKETTEEEAFGDITAFRVVLMFSEVWFRR